MQWLAHNTLPQRMGGREILDELSQVPGYFAGDGRVTGIPQ